MIPIWNTPWLWNKDNPCISTPNLHYLGNFNITTLIDMNTKKWNENIIRHVRNVNEIIKTPDLNLDGKDEIIWRFDKKCLYSVKSAYRVCVDVLINQDKWKVEGDWNILWALPIPPKVKHFMWRLGREYLPNRQRLMNKS